MNQTILCLTDDNFSEYVLNPVSVENNELFLIDFWANWCNPCKIIAPIIEEIAIELHDKLKVAKLNIDDNPVITKNYNIRSIPTLLLIRKGMVLSTQIGVISSKKLKEFISTYIDCVVYEQCNKR